MTFTSKYDETIYNYFVVIAMWTIGGVTLAASHIRARNDDEAREEMRRRQNWSGGAWFFMVRSRGHLEVRR